MKPVYRTTLQFDEDDLAIKLKIEGNGVSIIDTWRRGAKVVLKEIRFGPQTDEHDYQFKLKHAIKFLESGAKLKA